MSLWLDAQISPRIARWINQELGFDAIPVRDLGFRNARDRDIFSSARDADAVVLPKDADFVRLLRDLGPPPRVIWLRCGNTSERRLQENLLGTLSHAIERLDGGESLVEIVTFH
jgi:predicted nuclease of predicted toxin-antitoxin system